MANHTRQMAINAKCRDCRYDPLDQGTWRQQIENCGCPDCPLYEYRPISIAANQRRITEKLAALPPEEAERSRAKATRLKITKATVKKRQSGHSEDAADTLSSNMR
jgi:hypothetical protein